ncbi:hypothetical protein DERP_013748 [Dermatophagoides pteronyssinus]|nr:hypothetical protein DERP_013748 [Dermatophagoides pteronyssinus]
MDTSSSALITSVNPLLPALVPLATLLWLKAADLGIFISRDTWDQEYDYIVVGAGSAGAVVANRLSEDHRTKVLLLEAGGSETLFSDIPIAAATLQMTPIDWAYQTEPQTVSCFGLKNQRSRWPRGRVLGGSSVLNYMLYVRGNRRDYDRWVDLGAYGWSWHDVLPYFIKSEDNQDPNVASNGYHGIGGYLTVANPPDSTPISLAFPEAGKHLGYPNVDINGPTQTGFTIPQGTIRNGARCSTSKAFLSSVRDRQNLHILTFAYATKVIFNEYKRAVAVQFDRFSLTHIVYARKEIILSGGSVNTAQLLMLSGIGPSDHLHSLGIPIIADLPVGKNLQDHIYPGGIHFTIDKKYSMIQRRVSSLPNTIAYFALGRGPWTLLGGVEGLGFIKTKFTNRTDDWPDFEIHLVSGGPSSDDGQTFRRVQGYTDEMWHQVYQPYVKFDTFSLYPVMLRPESIGYIELRSTNPYDPPIIDPKYLTHQKDIESMVDAMKICIAVGLTPPYRKMKSRLIETVFPGCEHYEMWSDEYLACVARTFTSTLYHPVGTAKMGAPWDPTAVVDPELRVLGGVKGLRVADGSVMPKVVSGNTNAPIIMIGERVSDMIKGINLPRYDPATAKRMADYWNDIDRKFFDPNHDPTNFDKKK